MAVVMECCGQQHWLDGLWVVDLPFAKRGDGSFQVTNQKAGAAEHHALVVWIKGTAPHGTLDMADGIGWSATGRRVETSGRSAYGRGGAVGRTMVEQVPK